MNERKTDNISLEQQRAHLRSMLIRFPEILNESPSAWFPKVTRQIIKISKDLPTMAPEEKEFVKTTLNAAKDQIRLELAETKDMRDEEVNDSLRATRTGIVIVDFSRKLAEPFAPELCEIEEKVVSIEELVAKNPDKLKINTKTIDSEEFKIIEIKNTATNTWHEAIIPPNNNIWYKGGLARAMLKIHANANYSSEVPWNDLDITFVGDEHEARRYARIMGVDEDGVEMIDGTSGNINFNEYAHGRDLTMSQVGLSSKGLHYSDAAYNSAKTGHIELVAEYLPNRAIFGVDKSIIKGVSIIKPRGAMRLFKSLAEDKALSFNYPEINNNFGLGIYSLVLAKRWASRKDFPLLMQKMFFLAKKAGFVEEDNNDILKWLDETHQKYPYFNVDKKITSIEDVARWKGEKFIKLLDRHFGWSNNISSGINLIHKDGDTKDKLITIEGFSYSEKQALTLIENWDNYLKNCRKRTQEDQRLNNNPYLKYFYEADTWIPQENEN